MARTLALDPWKPSVSVDGIQKLSIIPFYPLKNSPLQRQLFLRIEKSVLMMEVTK